MTAECVLQFTRVHAQPIGVGRVGGDLRVDDIAAQVDGDALRTIHTVQLQRHARQRTTRRIRLELLHIGDAFGAAHARC